MPKFPEDEINQTFLHHATRYGFRRRCLESLFNVRSCRTVLKRKCSLLGCEAAPSFVCYTLKNENNMSFRNLNNYLSLNTASNSERFRYQNLVSEKENTECDNYLAIFEQKTTFFEHNTAVDQGSPEMGQPSYLSNSTTGHSRLSQEVPLNLTANVEVGKISTNSKQEACSSA